MRSGPAGVDWVTKSVKGVVELELDYRLVVVCEVVVKIILLPW
jgi:hypothetical protein